MVTMTDTSVMNYAGLTSAVSSPSAVAAGSPASAATSNSMAAAAAFYQQQAAASAALASLDTAAGHHHHPLASAAAASTAALASVDTPRYPWMSITGKTERGLSRTLLSHFEIFGGCIQIASITGIHDTLQNTEVT